MYYTRCFVLAVGLLLTTVLAAQDRQGSVYLGGGTSLLTQRVERDVFDAHILPGRALLDSYTRGGTYRSGYFLTHRLLLGAQLRYADPAMTPPATASYRQQLQIEPFLRYYFLDLGQRRPVSVFGELGFATFAFGGGPRYETDFHLGLGAETEVAPGIVGTVNLNYNANASGLNLTDLNIGLNVLTGQLAGAGVAASLTPGTWVTNGQLGRVAYGRMVRGDYTDSRLQLDLRPRIGYAVAPGLVVEVGGDWERYLPRVETSTGSYLAGYYPYDRRAVSLQARYYPLQRGRLLPFVSAVAGGEWLKNTGVYGGPLFRSYEALHLGGGLGAAYFLSTHLAVDLSVDYRHEYAEGLNWFNGPESELPHTRLVGELGLRYYLHKPRYSE